MTKLVVFEDQAYENFYPLTRFRPVCELLSGINTLLRKIEDSYGEKASLHVRSYLVPTLKKKHKTILINSLSGTSQALFINGRILAGAELPKLIPLSGKDTLYIDAHGEIVAARVSKGNLDLVRQKLAEVTFCNLFDEIKDNIEKKEVSVTLLNFPWELIKLNSDEIQKDFKRILRKPSIKGKIHPSVVIYNKEKVFIDEGAEVEALCVLDARKGPIYISKNALIKPLSLIEGPAYIGEETHILSAQIRSGTSIGPHCKIGGEVSVSIILGYSNKAHYGFLGHAYLAEWVNLGAGTTNSNLKNTYSGVKIWNKGKIIESGEQFLGCLIGDHVKTAIGTMINTGSVIDVVSNIFDLSPTPKYIPPFSWGKDEEYTIEKAFEVARICAERRKIIFDEAEKKLFRVIAKQAQN
ncbi:MAG: putative sugar nucleotidyl transferase [Candidatus Saganbacteria bacterium]|nr:putative sugar nucleotidyl transferase [Candidatus Saganbacteria bacterium]